MTNIIDRTSCPKGKSSANRHRFLQAHKKQIREAAKRIANTRSIKDMNKGADISIDNIMSEPTFQHDWGTGTNDRVYTGNDRFSPGDKIDKPESGQGTTGTGGATGEDPFEFHLTKEEFKDLFFEGLELPNQEKLMLTGSKDFKWKRAGYTIVGTPSNINIKKTFENSLARRIATRAEDKEPAFLDDIDIRYNNRIKVPKPIKKCVMHCLMDVSGSMDQPRKERAKRFYILLYLFLEKCYDDVEVVFIKHHHEATECTEDEFFNSRESGGTLISPAIELLDDIITKRYKGKNVNHYIAQCSDGDNGTRDAEITVALLQTSILPKVQYYAYLQVAPTYSHAFAADLLSIYQAYIKDPKMQCRVACEDEEVYPVFRELFKKVETK